MNTLVKEPMTHRNIVFTTAYGQTEVMRITRDGVFVNPDVAVDDAAKAVLDAIDSQIKVLVQKAVEDEREACAKVCEGYDVFGPGTRERFAEAIQARGGK